MVHASPLTEEVNEKRQMMIVFMTSVKFLHACTDSRVSRGVFRNTPAQITVNQCELSLLAPFTQSWKHLQHHDSNTTK